MEPQYMLYITHHPAALAHLSSLPQTPALAAYHNTTRALAQQLSHAWDLPSLLIKPVQRLLKYALLLHAIIEETPDSHGDKDNLRRAKAMVEDVSRAINEGQRRREIVKEVFAAGKPAELLKKKGLGIVGRVRGGVGVSAPRSISRADSEEAVQVAQMERDIIRIDAFIQQFAKETLEWVKSVQALMSALRVWAEGFGRVIGLGPDVTSEAFDAFLVVVDKQLASICTELEAVVREQLLPQLSMLLETQAPNTASRYSPRARAPPLRITPTHSAKGRPPPALNDASTGVRRAPCTALCGAACLSEAPELWCDVMRSPGSKMAGTPVARRACTVERVVGCFTCRGGDERGKRGDGTCLASTLGRGRTRPARAQHHQP
jgi:hypothetical protein